MADFSEIYLEYFSDVYKYVLSLCMDEALSEEITQDTFFKAMQSIDKFNGSCTLYVWLCQIAKNAYFTHYKKKKRMISDLGIDRPNTLYNLESDYLDKDTAKRLHIELHNLREPYKEVFTLRVFGELPFSQIGDLFAKTDSWARLIFYRAKKHLQEVIK
ncbi:sigma-70 family RNA polymerase sigma factor [Irregularibacter muris]|uniref:Sigma-70 family RNA polymerase sigma factor n=1 Tax=Irregularibacter muris TaxID=1796619 RepID=A0AAE3HDL2_9FIRM|nr:sigma-70 family RNA polymerase sigma factor [Irregularibacter muris]MCR1897485.1 sigma-70 family RNA polymerase sigma factor [Irregularibacter muris]